MNEELKLILYSLRQKITFGNGTSDNLCRIITSRTEIDEDGDISVTCIHVSCLNCLVYQDYNYATKVIHVWNKL